MLPPIDSYDTHIRPIHLRKDIPAVTNLVERCFDEHMDKEGRMYLQNMRRISREGEYYYLDATSPETSSIPFHGFVWEDHGKIIGNITLIYFKKRDQNIYFIANVAVEPEFRGQGIARKLTQRALSHVREHNGKAALLQVREDNQVALKIYQSLGFYEINRRTTWGLQDPGKSLGLADFPGIHINARRDESWPQQKEWLAQLYPEKVTWFLPFQISKYEPGFLNRFSRWINSESIRFWEARDGDRLIGLGILETINTFQDYLWLATSPVYEETAIPALISSIARKMHHPQKILVNYPAERAVAAFTAAGMNVVNTLIWMENSISIANRLI